MTMPESQQRSDPPSVTGTEQTTHNGGLLRVHNFRCRSCDLSVLYRG